MKTLRAILALVGLSPSIDVAVRAAAWSRFTSLAGAIELAFVAMCHHLPDRTLVIGGAAMTVCSRCAGLYAGVAIAALCPSLLAPTELSRAFALASALTLADVVTQDLGLHAPYHPARLVTGFLIGATATAWLLAAIEEEAARRFEVARQGSAAGPS